ncbi:GNAT family N-acetyltransferase [Alterisphingorhabdus coralli]|uniref:GNAT family N-acetyltransferase n=1 Tax=Alterisphingorhabdus coralli TaxID=3071408 RepID=A0AA97FA44_9SPHN|nr:GNAT family N-acetyltransferase [Parasphingorhabdus sp. SCSIO 66989]WOE76057.1 GNAT family N-acetyltransferase [Parasphingorhabdus sp. SCSIO 66989]
MAMVEIRQFDRSFTAALTDITLRSLEAMHDGTRAEVFDNIYKPFYLHDEDPGNTDTLLAIIEAQPEAIWVASIADDVVGFIAVRMNNVDALGEVFMLTVSPAHQGKGVGQSLLSHVETVLRNKGMKIVTVETITQDFAPPAKRIYENLGYDPWPVERFFKIL